MERLLVVVVLSLLAALAVPGAAHGSHSFAPYPGPPDDKIDASGLGFDAGFQSPCPNASGHFEANAQVAATGTTITGPGSNFFTKIDYTSSPGGSCLGFTSVSYKGDVICLDAVLAPNSHAIWRGLITDVEFTDTSGNKISGIPGILSVGDTVLAHWVDKDGPFGSGGSDEAAQFRTPPGQSSCPFIPFATVPITQGNLLVHDSGL